ncbi:putative transposase [Caldanaerobius fijiensis DSM 17918]|uniref:Putative transposase n=1 Tax=Caldanaerobius fijiensis DSM 17918 TaxID=1121256 RepID=A0A1M5E069_9THEO|nr:putative transposase [Caldanaerobius fijiensis DSM 17918]
MNVEYNTNRHACYNLKYHLVIVTKYRHKCLTNEMLKRLENILSKWSCTLIEFNGEADHIHILFEAPPQVQLSKLINNLKTVTSRLIRKEYAEYLSKFYWKPYLWNRKLSYFVIRRCSY